MPTPQDPSAWPSVRRTVQTLVVGLILLALGIRGLVAGPQGARTVLWIGSVAVGSVTLLVGAALLFAPRGKPGDDSGS